MRNSLQIMKTTMILTMMLLSTISLKAQQQYNIPDIPLANKFESINFIHITHTGNIDSIVKIEENQIIGHIQNYPDKLSERFNNEIESSNKYYEIGDFINAKKILDNPIILESQNTFILYYYARACYKVDKINSFKTYKKLVAKLDSTYHNKASAPVIDLWFLEAYWKLGTLYMDNNDWNRAYFEISRFLLGRKGYENTPIYSQALEFLTECAYNLYDDNLAIYLAKRTLSYDPTNQYVKGILIKLQK